MASSFDIKAQTYNIAHICSDEYCFGFISFRLFDFWSSTPKVADHFKKEQMVMTIYLNDLLPKGKVD
jgi:hypothetical protein